MDGKTSIQPDYEQLYMTIYAYKFGSISFLELLKRIEETLEIHCSDQAEMLDMEFLLVEQEGR